MNAEAAAEAVDVLHAFMASMHQYALDCRRRITRMNRGEFDSKEMARQNGEQYVAAHQPFCKFSVKASDGTDGSQWPSPFDSNQFDAKLAEYAKDTAVIDWTLRAQPFRGWRFVLQLLDGEWLITKRLRKEDGRYVNFRHYFC